MANRGLVVLAVLLAVGQAAWSQDDKAGKKKKKKAQAAAATATKPRWEYKVVRADELVPRAGTAATTSVSPDGTASATATATTRDGPGAIADALNKLGQDGWELVAVDSPARLPAIGGMGGGLGGLGGGAGGGRSAPTADMVDRMWEAVAPGKDRIDLDDPANKAARERVEQRHSFVPASGVLTKERFKEAFEKRLAAGPTRAGGVATFAAAAPGPAATYYLKRAKD